MSRETGGTCGPGARAGERGREAFSSVGKSIPRVDALAKVLGKAKYPQDLHRNFPDLLHVKVLRSPHAHARIETIDISGAKNLTGVHAVLTGRDKDIPWMYVRADVYAFPAKEEVIWAGQGVAAVAAETPEIARQALEAIQVKYRVLPHVLDVEAAMKAAPVSVIDPDLGRYEEGVQYKPAAPNVGGSYRLRTGDVEKGFAEADVVLENRFYASRISHSQLERASCVVQVENDGGITMWTNGCGVHGVIKSLICRMFRLPQSKVRIIQTYQGGSFGNRLIPYVEPLAVLMALRTRRAVEVTFSRREMFTAGPSNWPVTTFIKTGAKKDGTIVAQQIRLIKDTGATLNSQSTGRMTGSGAVCVYRIPNFAMDTCGVNTNTPPVGPYRGLGCPQVEWAVESQIDMLAEALGMDPVEIRKKNVLRKGERNAYGETITSIGAIQCLEAVAAAIRLDEPCPQESGPWARGKGIALGGKQNTPLGRSEVEVLVHSDGFVEVLYSTDENGMGSETVMAQIAAEQFKISVEQVTITRADTAVTPYDNYSASSRTTYNTGNALVIACQDAIRQLREQAARIAGVAADKVEVRNGKAVITGSNLTEIRIPDLFGSFQMFGGQQQWGLKKGTPVRGKGVFAPAPSVMWDDNGRTPRMWNWFQYSACAVEVAVNRETGRVKVLRAASASDMGFPINPKMCEGQIEGGVCMSLGFSLNEEYLYDDQGVTVNAGFMDYRIPTTLEMPSRGDFQAILAPDPLPDGPYGAKGVAESVTIPVAPAIGAAVYNAVGVRPKRLPMNAERILQLIQAKTGEA